jgi:hypothetical protein
MPESNFLFWSVGDLSSCSFCKRPNKFSSIQRPGSYQTLMVLSLLHVISYCLSSLNLIWVIAPVWAFKTYNGIPSLLYQNVTQPCSSPEIISLP